MAGECQLFFYLFSLMAIHSVLAYGTLAPGVVIWRQWVLSSFATADTLAPNWHQGISRGNADLSSVEYLEIKTMVIYSDLECFMQKKTLK